MFGWIKMVNTIVATKKNKVATKQRNIFGICHLTRIHRLNSPIFSLQSNSYFLLQSQTYDYALRNDSEIYFGSRRDFQNSILFERDNIRCWHAICSIITKRKWWSRMWFMMTSHKMQCESMRSMVGPFTRYTKFVLRKLCMQRRAVHRKRPSTDSG